MSFQHPHDEPQPYPLILRTRSYAWWRPVVGLLLLGATMILFGPVLAVPVFALAVAVDHEGSFTDAFNEMLSLETVTWQNMLFLNIALAALIPATWFVVRFLHGLAPRWLSSVLPGIRWKFLWACFGLSVVAIVASVVVSAFLPSDPNDLGASVNDWTGRMTAIAVVVAVTTPLQALGEEYAFRGYLFQAFGALTRRPWIAVVLTSLLFAGAHGGQNLPLFIDRLVFGLMAGYVVLRTGGLEAGIALHVWNNLAAFGFALLLGDIDETLNVSGVPWSNILLTLSQNGIYLVLVLLVAHRMGITSRSTPPVLVPTTPHV